MLVPNLKIYNEEPITNILCDICGESCKKSADYEYAYLSANWGYDSKKDGEQHRAHLCEKCYNKVRDFIEQTLKGKVLVENNG